MQAAAPTCDERGEREDVVGHPRRLHLRVQRLGARVQPRLGACRDDCVVGDGVGGHLLALHAGKHLQGPAGHRVHPGVVV